MVIGLVAIYLKSPQAQEAHEWVRQWLKEKVSPAVAEATRIQYGGELFIFFTLLNKN